MNLQLVKIASSGPCTFRCRDCERRVNQAHGNVYADLDGRAFVDYYCALCAGERRRQTFMGAKLLGPRPAAQFWTGDSEAT